MIHGLRQLADVILPGNRNMPGKITVGYPSHGLAQLGQLGHQPPHEHGQQCDAQKQADAAEKDTVVDDPAHHLPVGGGRADAYGDPAAAGAGNHIIFRFQPVVPPGDGVIPEILCYLTAHLLRHLHARAGQILAVAVEEEKACILIDVADAENISPHVDHRLAHPAQG